MSLRPRVRTSAPTSARGSVEQRLWAPVRVALTIGGPGAPDGRSHTSGRSMAPQLPHDVLMMIFEALTKSTSPREMCDGIENVLEALSRPFNEAMWRQVVDMLHLPPNSFMSAMRTEDGFDIDEATEAGIRPRTAREIFNLWCHHDPSLPPHTQSVHRLVGGFIGMDFIERSGWRGHETTRLERIMYTWIHFIIMYHERPDLGNWRRAGESLLFCMDRYGGWVDWKEAVGALWKVRDIELLKWFLEKFFKRDNFAQRRAGMSDELLGHALSQVFSSATAIIPPLTYGIPSIPKPYEVLFASLLEPPFNFTLGYVTYAILRNSVRLYTSLYSAGDQPRFFTFVALLHKDMFNYWVGDIPGKERVDALLELMWRFEPLFNEARDEHETGGPWSRVRHSPARGLCIPLHLFLSAINSNAHEELNTAIGARKRGTLSWRSLRDWSQGFEGANDVFKWHLSVPEWFDDV